MEKKSEITIGGELAATSSITVSVFGKDLMPVSREYVDTASPEFASSEEITVVSTPAPLSPEHAQALRQAALQPEPIPEGALYHVRAYAETGEPCSHEVLAGLLGEEAATDLGKVTTHAHAVEACLAANEKLESLGASVWLGVYGSTEAEGPSSESTGTGVP